MKQKLLLLLAVLLPSLSASAYDFKVDGICYNILSSVDKTCEVTSDYYGGNYVDVVIPRSVSYRGLTFTVSKIGRHAFKYYANLKSVVIPNSVTSIEEGAFSDCTSLTTVEIPNSVTSIGMLAFHYCSSLKTIFIPNSVTSIEEGAFFNCRSLTTVEIPNSVTKIEKQTFSDCI